MTTDQLVGRHPAFGAHARFVSARLAELAHRAYQHGLAEAYRQVRTTDEVAALLGIAPRTVRYHATRRDIGWQIGRDRLFRPQDVAALEVYVGRPPGRYPGEE